MLVDNSGYGVCGTDSGRYWGSAGGLGRTVVVGAVRGRVHPRETGDRSGIRSGFPLRDVGGLCALRACGRPALGAKSGEGPGRGVAAARYRRFTQLRRLVWHRRQLNGRMILAAFALVGIGRPHARARMV
ncbi:hypothetical protein MPSD_10060 [Mycobacterium pseudoshottsii JCM 15466]|uniref:Uncharacterized protein n=1 Tax=Mycobacterium pseudoshottsii TaxID=265949 RepID=A0A9N7LMN8_9MYCO|nr:hypothetical protein MPSD_10060 [Mycobacterium pseudoshottsii JCM 15466]BDN80781.1 hypothetical protein NJB1907Z4_C09960 [Mycobacterium pseudoshottsii]